MLLCWYHSPSPVCGLSLPSVCGVASMPKAYRTPGSGEELILWSERCWTPCAAGAPGLAGVCPGRLLLPVCVPSCWLGSFPKPFGLLQELWLFHPCSCRTGHFLCWDPLALSLIHFWHRRGVLDPQVFTLLTTHLCFQYDNRNLTNVCHAQSILPLHQEENCILEEKCFF